MSKSATILGLLFGLIIVLLSMVDFDNGELIHAFFSPQALAVVLGGTFAAVMINYPLDQIACIFKGLKKVVTAEPHSLNDTIEEIRRLSHISHRNGVLSLEKQIDSIEDSFLRFSLSEMMIYQEMNELMSSLNNRQFNMQLRHMQCQELFNNMASYAPAFGMMGTVMGLIIMMTAQASAGSGGEIYEGGSEDVLAGLLGGMGLALVTTFYGVLFSNLVFIPVAGKLKVLSEAEALKNEIIIRGVSGLKQGHSPLLVMESMMGFVNEKTKQKLEGTR